MAAFNRLGSARKNYMTTNKTKRKKTVKHRVVKAYAVVNSVGLIGSNDPGGICIFASKRWAEGMWNASSNERVVPVIITYEL